MFKLTLQPVGSGWLNVFIEFGEFTKEFVASNAGSDLCVQLVHVANSLLSGLDEKLQAVTVEMYGEPEGLTLYFTTEADKVTLGIYYVEDFDIPLENQQLGECLAKSEIIASAVSQTIYTALKELLISRGLEYLSDQWQEFPLGGFLNLHRKLDSKPKLLDRSLKGELECLMSILESK